MSSDRPTMNSAPSGFGYGSTHGAAAVSLGSMPPSCPTSRRISRFRGVWRLWAVVAVVALAVGACSGVASEQSSVVLEPATSVDVSDLDTSVRAAVGMLLDSPGIVIEQTEEIDGVVAARLWMEFRPGSGDFVSVESVDTLVRSRVLDRDGGVLTAATVVVDDSRFQAVSASPDMPLSASIPWQVVYEDLPEADSDPLPTFVDVRDMAEGEYNSDLSVSDAYRRDLTSGATHWILVTPFGEGTTTQQWLIGPDGILQTYTVAFEGHATALEGPIGLPSKVHIGFTPVDPSDHISQPTVGDPLDLDDGTLP